jgi:hypothetical protein
MATFCPLSFAQDNLQATDTILSDHEFALLFGLVQPLADPSSALPSPAMWDIFGNPIAAQSKPSDLAHLDQDIDPDYNVPGSL